MAGVRLHHPDLRGCMFTVVHMGRPMQAAPVKCPTCRVLHHFKTYHLPLDQLGDVVVSETVFVRLCEAGLAPLVATGEVAEPEEQHLDMGGGIGGTNGRLIRPGKEVIVSREGGA